MDFIGKYDEERTKFLSDINYDEFFCIEFKANNYHSWSRFIEYNYTSLDRAIQDFDKIKAFFSDYQFRLVKVTRESVF